MLPQSVKVDAEKAEENNSNDSYQISLSIGVSRIDLSDDSPLDEAIKKADKEMYKSKTANKKNRK